VRLVEGYSVVVPLYNSGAVIEELVARLGAVLGPLGRPYEIILVDDGSQDGTAGRARRLAESFPHVRSIELLRNYGQHNATLCGVRAAQYGYTITLDDDLQNPPEEIPKLLAALENDSDVVYGCPITQRHGLWRNLASRLTKFALATVMGAKVARQVSAYRAFRTSIREAFVEYRGPFVSIDVLLTWGTTKFDAVVVEHDERAAGRSNYTFAKLASHALNMMTGFSTTPLKVASVMGFVFTLFGLGVLAMVVGRYLIEGTEVPGFPFLASIISIFSGVQLFALGIMGEYLARMHYRMMDRPSYAVRPPKDTDPGTGGA
jgi:undecaprenyl-phosphate 4-deoxy-4-formamido-L-arabinose transferase